MKIKLINMNKWANSIRMLSHLQELPKPAPRVICVEGNIGSGKTSLIKYLTEQFSTIETLEEPVNKWRTVGKSNLLDLMYKDPKRWSYTLQTYVLLTMLQNHQKTSVKEILVLERSIYSAVYCFVENLYMKGKFTEVEYKVHHEWFQWIKHSVKPRVDLFIYLHTTPDRCLQRIKERGRFEENNVDIKFLQTVHESHEDWLIKQDKFDIPAQVLIINGNLNTNKLHQKYHSVFEQYLKS